MPYNPYQVGVNPQAGMGFMPQAPVPGAVPGTWQQPAQQSSPVQWQPSSQSPRQLIEVNGRPSAEAYPMGPNEAVPMFDSNKNILYVKKTDGAGVGQVFDYEINPIDRQPEDGTPSDYVTREEFNDTINRILEAIKDERGTETAQSDPEPAAAAAPTARGRRSSSGSKSN